MISIEMVHHDALLAIFDFYVDEDQEEKQSIEAWQTLVHVCRRWRSIIFASPRRLNLRPSIAGAIIQFPLPAHHPHDFTIDIDC